MNNYLLTIFLVSIGIGVVNIIAPNIKSMGKYIKTVGFLIILSVIISPISNVLQYIDESFFEEIKDNLIDTTDDNKEKYEEILNNFLNEYSTDEIKKQINTILLEKFAIPEDECEIQVYTDYVDNRLILSEIRIILLGKSIFKNPYQIEKYICELFKCECVVLIK